MAVNWLQNWLMTNNSLDPVLFFRSVAIAKLTNRCMIHFLLLSGCNVRVDTTLVGFDQNLVNWERGNMSFIFKGAGRVYKQGID